MGADFIYSLAPAPVMTEARVSELKTLIAGLDRDDFADDGPAFDEDMSLNECRAAVTEIIDVLIEGRRDVGNIKTATMPCAYLLSGGMSHGDLPTEGCEILSRVEDCGAVWWQLEAWALEDGR